MIALVMELIKKLEKENKQPSVDNVDFLGLICLLLWLMMMSL